MIFDVFNRLSIICYFASNVKIDNFDLKTYHFETSTFDENDNVIQKIFIQMSSNFRSKLFVEYDENVN